MTTHSFNGAIIGTTFVFVANMDAICLMMLSVRCTLVELECHWGNEILCPELSNLEEGER